MKYFDVVNEQDEVIGTATAQQCHTNPQLIHRVVHFTLLDQWREKILISKRSELVKYDSGMWCFMGEHLLQSDNYVSAVMRGVADELACTVIDGMQELGHTIFHQPNQTEFARFFGVPYKACVIKPNPSEISEIKWVSLPSLKKHKHEYSKMTQYWIDHIDWATAMQRKDLITQLVV